MVLTPRAAGPGRPDRATAPGDRPRGGATPQRSHITIRRVYDPPVPGEGLRVLVMRLWPRGVRKEAVDLWVKELGAELDNLRAWKGGRIDWPEMRRRYLAGLEAPPAGPALARLRDVVREQPVALMCSCVEESQCHRSILKALLE
ncbi:MAG TPA: DUF488 family protein [Candidatus Binatia bacterium]|nr:DUF488 family protein [Candidatus Binatia bacterium]